MTDLLSDLTKVAQQGVLWLNTCLTVRAHKAHSHSKQGWETFTTAVLKAVTTRAIETEDGETRGGVVFMSWGAPALKICQSIGVNSVGTHSISVRHRCVNLEFFALVQEEPPIEVPLFLVKFCFWLTFLISGLLIRPLCLRTRDSWATATSKPPTNGSRRHTARMDRSTGLFSIRNFYQRSILRMFWFVRCLSPIYLFVFVFVFFADVSTRLNVRRVWSMLPRH